ncbi:C4-dicarboxylate ABC transporter [Faecalibacter rhinopitheci]|uniref:C4-dicarboxylate ABC transporter n=1 Tax=Faecalibacter rhinopitheci TaxID=2779678 RepID=A0A8J7KCI3_9FLAO|nr:C4-dicarboxylate ABC transporter [Faecalibacter rhinopitheci]MBF0596266.1 C4-dicarboxylate ABC transporter [Faecalibacter rhinopitheci]MBQ0148529.1 C4-dicarboxylate ABC transporter [Candidatus Onthonaster equi]
MNKNIAYGIIGFGYLLIGIFTWRFKYFIKELDDTQALLFGILFIIYGSFRIYRAIKAYKNGEK